ncbi:hypothetical protein Tco_0779271 [Tanacetum coccineum]
MTSITAQQTKLDLELAPKENRLDIGKCNGRITRGLKPKDMMTSTDSRLIRRKDSSLPWKSSKISFDSRQEVYQFNHDVVYRSDASIEENLLPDIINRSLSGKTNGLDKLRLSRAQILWGMYHQKLNNKDYKRKTKIYLTLCFTKVNIQPLPIQIKSLSWRNKIGMHTSKDDYLINTLRFVSRKEASQIYGAVLPEMFLQVRVKEM